MIFDTVVSTWPFVIELDIAHEPIESFAVHAECRATAASYDGPTRYTAFWEPNANADIERPTKCIAWEPNANLKSMALLSRLSD